MGAGLARVDGNRRDAQRLLAEATEHEYFSSRECTYVARKEAEAEMLRHKIVSSSRRGRESAKDEALVLSEQCVNSHHALLAMEFKTIAAEAATDPAERKALVADVRLAASSSGYNMRLADLEMTSKGGSAIEHFAL